MANFKQGVTHDGEPQSVHMSEPQYKDFVYERYNCIDERTGQVTEAIVIEDRRMSKAAYYAFVEKTFADMLEMIKKKNADYCGRNDDPFANFRRAEAVGVDPLQGLAVRFLDKVARIESFFQSGKLENESFEDAWLDAIGYSCLALGMLHEKHKK